MRRYFLAINYYRLQKPLYFGVTIAIAIIGVILALLLYQSENTYAKPLYDFGVDPFINTFTFFLAIFLGLESIYNEYEETLPLLLTVHFMKPGLNGDTDRYVMSCHKAVLASEADLRQWAQQIGQQMNEGKHLQFKPFFKITKRKELIKYNEEDALHYEVVYVP